MDSLRVLLVDDTKTVLFFEKQLFMGTKAIIDTASNGKEALQKVQEAKPDVILLDIVMPVMDGFETLKALKENPDTADIPVIMVTTKGEEEHINKARGLKCDYYLTKPISKTALFAAIKEIGEKNGK